MSPSLHDIYLARQAIQAVAARTPLVYSPMLSQRYHAQIWLKLETSQPTGAFKLRGATYALSRLPKALRERGVITCSTGNHGRALAYAAKQLGIPATVCLSSLVPDNKVDAVKAMGARVWVVGRSQDEAEQAALEAVSRDGLCYIPPFDHPDIIAGQGTIGLEILEDAPDVDVIAAGLSGGGLVGGIGLAARTIAPHIDLIGISIRDGAAMHESIIAGKPVAVPESESLADSLGGGIGLNNQYTFALVPQVMTQHYQVDEAYIARAMIDMWQCENRWVEGAAVVGLAAARQHQLDWQDKKVVIVVSGNNVSTDTLAAVTALSEQVRP
ncbi:hydroxyectoine utilization dehydratase EutB [Salinivibrio siamensis]|uniref:Hydroxyectoine utilization dehydratase EutB n=1 Tax=Salinivibrio siamensis TaxID=414286 RepID=A0ABX3K6K7_9GAMM|nr:hydroxyectoine utilization dehydratase EutB [Salinivibrio siamensis]OOE83111.1 hydroxyectoine utilization dehydratase EutB [Salinivibrio siamensis]